MQVTRIIVIVTAIGLAGCGGTTSAKIKAESDHLTFLVFNDASKQEQCASMKRLRNLNAEAKNKEGYRFVSERIKDFC